MEFEDRTIRLDEYKLFLQQKLSALESFTEEHILHGIPITEVGIGDCWRVQLEDTRDVDTNGYTPLVPEREVLSTGERRLGTLDNPSSDAFITALVSKGAMGLAINDSEFRYDEHQLIKWLKCIHTAWGEFYCLYHTTAGLPGRGTEEWGLRWSNATGQPRHLFIFLRTIALISDYHKGSSSSGEHKNILRLLPHRLSRILIILLRVVRPVEFYALVQSKIILHEETAAATKLYGTQIFVSAGRLWDSRLESITLSKWLGQGLGFPMGLRNYRHFATALQRKFLRSDNTDHTHQMQDHSTAESESQAFVEVSKMWHALLGFETFPPNM